MPNLIPPAVVRVVGDLETLIAKLAEAKELLNAFSETPAEVKFAATLTSLTKALDEARAFIKAQDLTVPLEAIPNLGETRTALVTLRNFVKSQAPDIDIPLETTATLPEAAAIVRGLVDFIHTIKPQIGIPVEGTADLGATTVAVRAVEAWARSVAGAGVTIPVTAVPEVGASAAAGAVAGEAGKAGGIFGSRGATSGFFSSLFGNLLGSGAAGETSKLSTFFTTLLWGGVHGGGGGGMFGLAGFGSLADIAGFGPESLVIGPLLGLIGSAVGGLLGAGFLGIGAAGTAGAGFLTNMAGFGQAIGDIQSLYTILQQVKTGAITAKQGLKEFNDTLASLPTVAQGPALAFVKFLANTFVPAFDKATGPAEAKAIHIFTEMAHIAEGFFTTVGKFSSEDMTSITKALQPFFNWLKKTGMALYKTIMGTFQKIEPTGVKAITQAIELFGHITQDVGPFLGHFVTVVADLFTKLNTKTSGALDTFIHEMIGDFDAWLHFIESVADLGKALLPEFAGLGKNILNTIITPIFKTLTKFVETNKGLFKTFFSKHNQFIMALGTIMKALLPIIETLVKAFMNLAIAARPLSTGVLHAFATVIRYIDTLLMTISKLLTGKISITTAVKNITSPLWNPKTAVTGPPPTTPISTTKRTAQQEVAFIQKWMKSKTFANLTTMTKNLFEDTWQEYKTGKNPGLLTQMYRYFFSTIGGGTPSAGATPLPSKSQAKVGGTTTTSIQKSVYAALATALQTFRPSKADTENLTAGLTTSFKDAISSAFKGTLHVTFTVKRVATFDKISENIEKSIKGYTIGKYVGTRIRQGIKTYFQKRTLAGLIADIELDIKGYTIGKHVATRIAQGLKATLNLIIQAAKTLGAAIYNAIIGVISSSGHGAVSTHVRGLATGGLVTAPTLAVVGEAGPELILPLNKLGASLEGGVSPYSPTLGGTGGAVSFSTGNIIVNGAGNPQQTGAAVKTAIENAFRTLARKARVGVVVP